MKLFNALMPGEHNYQMGKPMPGQTPQPDPMKSGFRRERGPLMNALGGFFEFAAPEAYDMGRQRKFARMESDALGAGKYDEAGRIRMQAGDFEGGAKIADYGQQQQAASRQQEAQKLVTVLSSAAPEQLNQMAMSDPAGFEQMAGVSSDEYLQSMTRLMQEGGLSLQDAHKFVLTQAQAEAGIAPQGPVEGKAINDRLVNPYTAEVMGDFSDPVKPPAAMSALGKLRSDLNAGIITPEDYQIGLAELQRSGVNVNVNTGDTGPEVGTIPPGYALIKDPASPAGYKMVPIPGSAAEAEVAAGAAKDAKNLEGTDLTVGNLIGAYATLAQNKAITAQGNNVIDNIGALYSGTAAGKLQDQLGGGVGNLDNAEARQTIDGLSMNALMKMISMSDVSAKAMDSDAEMKAWMSAIKSDNYEAALTKLYILDKSFGKGTALQDAYANGVIDLDTYRRITNRVNSDPMTKQMADRVQRYADLGNAVGETNLTPDEMTELEQLRRELGVQ